MRAHGPVCAAPPRPGGGPAPGRPGAKLLRAGSAGPFRAAPRGGQDGVPLRRRGRRAARRARPRLSCGRGARALPRGGPLAPGRGGPGAAPAARRGRALPPALPPVRGPLRPRARLPRVPAPHRVHQARGRAPHRRLHCPGGGGRGRTALRPAQVLEQPHGAHGEPSRVRRGDPGRGEHRGGARVARVRAGQSCAGSGLR
mmetsp:Transcript_12855/g.43533  ORF Transcript_12855/g.43533 Transcript_12855/m.43533 type:complete len:200 (+) Transcript_12855:189-788(+)